MCVRGSCSLGYSRVRVLGSMDVCKEFVIEVMQVAFSCLIVDVVLE